MQLLSMQKLIKKFMMITIPCNSVIIILYCNKKIIFFLKNIQFLKKLILHKRLYHFVTYYISVTDFRYRKLYICSLVNLYGDSKIMFCTFIVFFYTIYS